MHPFLQDVSTLVFDTIFPIHCLGCGAENHNYICEICTPVLTKLTRQHCIMCHKLSLHGITHISCKTQHTPDQAISVFDYHDPRISRLIITGKYSFVPKIYSELGSLLREQLQNSYKPFLNDIDCVVPIPLAPQRKRWRGFNQTEVMAAEIASNTNIVLNIELIRIKNTKTQKDLNKADRQDNMDGSFSVRPKHTIANKNVLLVDDVLTTGATLLSAVAVLKQAGAQRVTCVTLARD